MILNNHYWLCWIDIEAFIDPGMHEARKHRTEAAHWLTITILNSDFKKGLLAVLKHSLILERMNGKHRTEAAHWLTIKGSILKPVG